MGRMKKKHKKIVEFKLSLTYTCPVTRTDVTIDLNGDSIFAHSSPCELCGEHGSVEIETPANCPSCGKMHDDIELRSW